MARWRLPKKKNLGPGFIVKIEEGTLTDTDAEWAIGDHGGVIRMRRGLTVAQQRYLYSHELIHAALDYHHKQVLEGAAP